MKKMNSIVAILIATVAVLVSVKASAQSTATNVAFYYYPTTLPDTSTLEFGTARDNYLAGISRGGNLDTGSRVGHPANVELRSVFDTGDIAVGTNNLWRGDFNPGTVYTNQHGERYYATVLMIGRGGRIRLADVSYEMTCDVALLGNNSSLAGLSYSVSRVGILAGPDGVLFTADDVIVKAGDGTNLVDAITFIGSRIGALVNQPSDFDPLNDAIGNLGAFMTSKYSVALPSGTVSGTYTSMLYQRGSIPQWRYQVVPFVGPQGVVFAVVGPPGVVPFTLFEGEGPNGPWTPVTSNASEGTSMFVPFLNATAFIKTPRYSPPMQFSAVLAAKKAVRLTVSQHAGSETDQDR